MTFVQTESATEVGALIDIATELGYPASAVKATTVSGYDVPEDVAAEFAKGNDPQLPKPPKPTVRPVGRPPKQPVIEPDTKPFGRPDVKPIEPDEKPR